MENTMICTTKSPKTNRFKTWQGIPSLVPPILPMIDPLAGFGFNSVWSLSPPIGRWWGGGRFWGIPPYQKPQVCIVQKFEGKRIQSLLALICCINKILFFTSNAIILQSMWSTFLKTFPHLVLIPYPVSRIDTHLPNELFFQKNLVRYMLILGNILQ
jgi:hypothetical protein